MKLEIWINDESEEYLLNLVSQGFYGEAWEFIERTTSQFHADLYVIAGRVMEVKGEKQ